MNLPLPPTSRVDTLTLWILRHRWAVLLGSVLLTLLVAIGMSRIEFKNDYRVFFSRGNPHLQAYESLQRVYSKDDNVLFVLTHPELEVFSPAYLESVAWLTGEAWKLPYVTRVESVTNFQNSEADGDDLRVGDLVEEPALMSALDLEKARAVAHREPPLKNRLVGSHAKVTGLNATMTLPGLDSMEVLRAGEAARELRDRFKARYPGMTLHLTGMVMMNTAFAEASRVDMMTLIPLMYLGMFLAIYVLLRSLGGTLGTILVIVLSTLVAMGMMGWVGLPLTPPSAVAPTIIMTLAVADSIHLLVTYLHHLREGLPRERAIRESMRVNFSPILLTSLTTGIGFLSLNFSDAPPFRHLGTVVFFGVWAAWVFSILFLPAFLAVVPLHVRRASATPARLSALAEWIIAHRRLSLWGSVAVVSLLAVFIPRIELNDQWVNYFARSIPFRGDTDYAMDRLTGIYTIEYSVPGEAAGGISDPAYLQRLDAFDQWLRKQSGVLQVNSLAHVMKRLNRNMHGDEPEQYRLPEQRDLAAQYLLLYEMSLPYGLDLNNQINVDKSASRLIATTVNLTTRQVRQLIHNADRWQAEHWPEAMRTSATSPTVMFAYISQSNIESMLGGTFLAVLLISVLLGLALQSVRYGLISLIPNLVPAVLGFGAWALLVGSIGMSLSVVTGMTLGIVVDDTVHFLAKYLRARREMALDAAAAVRYAFTTVGPAMLATTVILVIGFAILSFSAFRLNNWMAQLTAVVIAFALIADFILLPALLLTLDRQPQTQPSTKTQSHEAEPVLV